MFIPSTVPLSDCIRNFCDDWWRKVAAIDVGRNELREAVAGNPAEFVIATLAYMEAVENT